MYMYKICYFWDISMALFKPIIRWWHPINFASFSDRGFRTRAGFHKRAVLGYGAFKQLIKYDDHSEL